MHPVDPSPPVAPVLPSPPGDPVRPSSPGGDAPLETLRHRFESLATPRRAATSSKERKGRKQAQADAIAALPAEPVIPEGPTEADVAKALITTRANPALSAKMLGIPRSTLMAIIEASPILQIIVTDQKESEVDRAERTVYTLAAENDFRAARYVLETQGAKRGWGRKLTLTSENPDSEVLDSINKMSEADLVAFTRAINPFAAKPPSPAPGKRSKTKS